jgi:heat shock protein HslJ
MKLFNVFSLFIVSVLLISACRAPDGNQDQSQPELVGTSWQLIEYGDPANPTPVQSGSTVTLNFGGDGSIGGHSSCNTYGGSFSLGSGNNLTMSEIFSTLMACLEPGIMEQEAAYLGALNLASTYEIRDGQLFIEYEGGLMVFEPGS